MPDQAIRMVYCGQHSDIARPSAPQIHQHAYTEIFYFIDGQAKIIASGQTYRVRLYDMIVYPPQTPHQIEWKPDTYRRYISLGLHIPSFSMPHTLLLKDPDGRMRWLVENIYKESRAKQTDEILCRHLLRALLRLIEKQAQSDVPGDAIDMVLDYIAKQYAQPLTVTVLAQLIPASPSYLSRAIKQRTGLSPMQAVHKARVEAAKRLLVQTNLSIEEIAGQCGYVSSKHFSRIFKQAVDVSPRTFRTNQR